MGNSSTLISEEVKIIMDYLDSDKSLFLSSKHLGTEYNGAIFYRYYLWSALVGYSDVLVVNATSSSIYSGSYLLYDKDSANNSRLSEYIRALDYSYPLLVYNGTNIAAITVDTIYRVVYFAFPFESINSTQARREIMNATINFLNTSKGKPTRIEAASYTVEYATEISINATIYAEDSVLAGANVSIYIKLNGYWVLLGSAISNINGIISMPLNASYDPGRYMLAFVFPGNSTFSKAVSIVYLYITRRPSELKIISDTTIPDAGAEIVFNVTTNGKPYSTEVVIYVEGFLFCGTSDKNGIAKIFVSSTARSI